MFIGAKSIALNHQSEMVKSEMFRNGFLPLGIYI